MAEKIPEWLSAPPSFMPAQLVDKMTYEEYSQLLNDPAELKRVLDDASGVNDVGMTDAEVDEFLNTPMSAASSTGLTADAAIHTGAMIALMPDAETVARLSVPGGEPSEELHLTIVYLGEAAKIVPDLRFAIISHVRRVSRQFPVVDGEAFGVATWNPHKQNTDTSLIYNVGGVELDDMHDAIHDTIRDIMGTAFPEQYEPWSPHVCAAYSNDVGLLARMTQKLGPVRFDRLRVVFAGQYSDIPLYDGTEETSGEDYD